MDNQIHTDLRELISESRGVSAFFEASDDSDGDVEEGDGGEIVSEVHGVTQNGD